MAKNKAEKRFNIALNRLDKNTPFAIQEAYKAIRTNLLFSLVPFSQKIVVVSSALPNEGKSTTCGNLAITMAQTSAKIMLIDGDLRKPTQHRFFSVDNEKGLSNLLGGFDCVADAVKRNVVKNLDLVTAGALPPNPSELLGSENMELFLHKMEEYYDYILIDSPPINVVTDAVVLSKYAAGILLIARSMNTTVDDLSDALSTVKTASGSVLGVVVTDVVKGSGFGSYRSSRKHGYVSYYEDGYGQQPYRERKQPAAPAVQHSKGPDT